MARALLLIDLQNDYFAGGSLPLVGIDAAAAQAARALAAFREAGETVIHIRHDSLRPGAIFFLPGTPGAEIHASVAPLADEPVIVKHFPNAFRDTGLKVQLDVAGIDEVVVAGAMSHMCIDGSVRAAADAGYRCTVLADACATRDLDFAGRKVVAADVHAAFMAGLAGVYARVLPTEEFFT
jgi:nicotinamidase-related amidase